MRAIRVPLIVFLVVLAGSGVFELSRIRRSANAPQPQTSVTPDPSKDPVYVCPMDPDVRSNSPGNCVRCGMKLEAGIPDPVEFHVDFTITPVPPKVQEPALLKFVILDPWKDRPVKKFIAVHEKLFHAFVVSQDLEFFNHGHPTIAGDGVFQYPLTFPKSGMYRILTDFYPEGATPQLIAKTLFVAGAPSAPASLSRDYSTKAGENMEVSLETIPAQPTAGNRTQMRFRINPGEGLEKYLGAWAHMLAASDDLIDMMHQHPYVADGGPQIEFSVVFPRPRTYRVWVQFQRKGVVNTVHFDVPIAEAPRDPVGAN